MSFGCFYPKKIKKILYLKNLESNQKTGKLNKNIENLKEVSKNQFGHTYTVFN